MSELEQRLAIAKRIKEVIAKNGGYKTISEKTNISESTLVRAAAGKTDPKFRDITVLASVTNTRLSYLAYGIDKEDELQVAEKIGQLKAFQEHLDNLQQELLKTKEDLIKQRRSETKFQGLMDLLIKLTVNDLKEEEKEQLKESVKKLQK